MVQLWIEAITVGLGLVIVGTIVSWVASKVMDTELPPVCKDWNKNFIDGSMSLLNRCDSTFCF